MPEFKTPKDGKWNLRDSKLVIRLCIAQDGELYLEWYEGKVTAMDAEHPTIPERTVISVAKYIKLPRYMRLENTSPEEFKKLLSTHPFILYSFGSAVLSLLKSEAEERQRRADRDRALFIELNNIGRAFGITHP